MLPGQTCSTCAFWISNGTVLSQMRAAGVVNPPQPPGFCAINAPVKAADGLRWPITGGNEGCGQWQAKQVSN